jgi:hypothetical protein
VYEGHLNTYSAWHAEVPGAVVTYEASGSSLAVIDEEKCPEVMSMANCYYSTHWNGIGKCP